jgi:hypothetical protein
MGRSPSASRDATSSAPTFHFTISVKLFMRGCSDGQIPSLTILSLNAQPAGSSLRTELFSSFSSNHCGTAFIIKDRLEIPPQVLSHFSWPDVQAAVRRRDRNQGPSMPTAQHRSDDLTQRPLPP